MFRFKKFTIHQSKTAMKVCTDGCILGAYANVENTQNILDIGTGTGLLALMMAQRTDAKIDAVEIEENAYKQAFENISESPFRDSISVFHESIQNFTNRTPNQYDLIISNPPFYQNSLKSPDNQANKAHHAISLTFEELIVSVKKLLKKDGKFMVLLPPFETQQIQLIAEKNGFWLNKKLQIRHSSLKSVLREISTFSFQKTETVSEKQLCIYENDNKTYSQLFRELLKDYYLIF